LDHPILLGLPELVNKLETIFLNQGKAQIFQPWWLIGSSEKEIPWGINQFNLTKFLKKAFLLVGNFPNSQFLKILDLRMVNKFTTLVIFGSIWIKFHFQDGWRYIFL